MPRHELKFSLSPLQLQNVAALLADHLVPDPNGAEEDAWHYPVYSLYFDSPDFQFLKDKRDGLDERQKFRVRFYDCAAPSTYFFEMKKKNGSRISKSRIALSSTEAGQPVRGFFNSGAGAVSAYFEKMAEFAAATCRLHLRPTLWVAYRRLAFVSPFETDAVRVTIDTHLRYATFRGGAFETGDLRAVGSTPLILEIKFCDVPPAWLDVLMDQLRGARISLSKYATCVNESFRKGACF